MPGLIACGSVIQRSAQSGFKRSLASRKFGRSGDSVMLRIAGGVALEAGRGGAREQAARHVGLFGGERRHRLRNIGHGLLRERLKEAHQLAQFVVREVERRHVDADVRPHAVAVGIGFTQRRVGQEFPQPLGIDARALGQTASAAIAPAHPDIAATPSSRFVVRE